VSNATTGEIWTPQRSERAGTTFGQVGFAIRSSRPEDLDRLRSIYRRASLSNENDRQALLDNPQFLELPPIPVIEGRTRVAASSSGEIVGFATVEASTTEAELVDLFIDPLSRRRGAARALIDDAMSILSRHGIRTLDVTANPHALAFYEAVGFEITDSTTTPLGPGWRMRLTRVG
jgi:ribosomal protein S18 acetylase RimI-like enzyme